MRMRNLFSLAVAGIGCAAAVYAQTAAPVAVPVTYAQVPVIKANTRAVAVDVVVTRGQDEPVTSLSKQDFQILEDGKPQPIDFFEEHTAPALSGAALAPLAKMPPHVYTNIPSVPQGDSVNVLLLDSLNTDREDQQYVHEQILEFLKTMKPDARIAIFALGSKLRFIQGFTADSSLLQAALKDPKYGFSVEKPDSSRSIQDKQDDLEDVGRLAGMGMSKEGIEALQVSQAEFANYQADQRVAMTLEALQNIARYLAGVPGRKNLIWFSSSFPISVFPSATEKQPLGQTREYSVAIKKTADLLTLSKVAVYPISAEGVIGEHLLEARNIFPYDLEGYTPDNRIGASTSQRPVGGFGPYAHEADARATKMAAMEELAADTGGEAIFNTNDLAPSITAVTTTPSSTRPPTSR
jgi:VWFA-related protein